MKDRRGDVGLRVRIAIRVLELYDQNHPVKSIILIMRKGGVKVSRSLVYRIIQPFKPKPVESSTEKPWNLSDRQQP